jgi:hypothetical protein
MSYILEYFYKGYWKASAWKLPDNLETDSEAAKALGVIQYQAKMGTGYSYRIRNGDRVLSNPIDKWRTD